jgi:membrane protease YdiL (CAAX protease family)
VGAIVAAVALLAFRNVGDALVPSALYVPVNLGVAALLAVIAAAGGLSPTELGLSRRTAATGLATGTLIAVIVAAAIGVAAAIPWTRPLFEDQRVADVAGGGELAYLALVRIPLGTALFEELAFRGVLLALLARYRSTAAAVAGSSLLFGLWHIRPTLGAVGANDLAADAFAVAALTAGAVVVTAAAGALFCGLRLATGSLLAPVVVHGAINSLATVAAYVVLH